MTPVNSLRSIRRTAAVGFYVVGGVLGLLVFPEPTRYLLERQLEHDRATALLRALCHTKGSRGA